MEEIKKEAEAKEAESASHMKHHVTLARSVTLFQIAIALSAIAVLTKKRPLWLVSLALVRNRRLFLCGRLTLTRGTVVAAALVAQLFVPAIGRLADEPNDLLVRIVAFCKEHRGKRVGNGECTTVATAALLAAGAKPHGWVDRRTPPRRGEFNWGKLVFTVERDVPTSKRPAVSLPPRDVLQFQNVKLEGVTDFGTYTAQAQHHSAHRLRRR